jgi:hypothetical protein
MIDVIAAASAAVIFRVVPLACSGDRLGVAGGGVLRLADGIACSAVVPGRPLGVVLGDDGRVTIATLPADALPQSKIPRTAFILAPAAERDADETQLVTVTIDVAVPPRTPAGDDIYVSTERSNWNPNEIRMDQVDGRHYRLALQVHRGARVAFRITRGTYSTLERDAARALPPAHIAPGEPGAHVSVDVAAWADID